MNSSYHSRRDFLKRSALVTAGVGLSGTKAFSESYSPGKNPLPQWRGFNLLDFFSPEAASGRKNKSEYFKWMADWGFDFVRLPISYPSYLKFDRSRPIQKDEVLNFDEERLEEIDRLVDQAQQHGLHVSLNLHRAPGFCINAGFVEPYNLWKDQEALDAFCAHWEMWSKRYKNINSRKLSFDLVNEPFMRQDVNDQHSPGGPVPIEDYRRVAEAALKTIKAVKKKRLVIADGNGGGSVALPEFADLDLAQSCRGYFPHFISHYKAPWVYKDVNNVPDASWPAESNADIMIEARWKSIMSPGWN